LSIDQWNERYRSGEQLFETPSPLVVRFAGNLAPGRALDLACGPGRNSLFLAEKGWQVTAVDGSPLAIATLEKRAGDRRLRVDTQVADLERGKLAIPAGAFDLIMDCYYLQRDLLPQIKAGVRPRGLAIVIVHLANADQPHGTPTRARPGELRSFFSDWKILHDYEGEPGESCHKHSVAEVVAKKPSGGRQ